MQERRQVSGREAEMSARDDDPRSRRELPLRAVARAVYADIKALRNGGVLPAALAVSVRALPRASGPALVVEVTALPEGFAIFSRGTGSGAEPPRYTKAAAALLSLLSRVLGDYRDACAGSGCQARVRFSFALSARDLARSLSAPSSPRAPLAR
jgi:hypothetical protein